MSQTLPVVVDCDSLFSKVAEVVRSNAKGAIKELLFGSLARREANKDSDVDLLLVWPADGCVRWLGAGFWVFRAR